MISSTEHHTILAPAIADSIKDVTRASVSKAGIIQKVYVSLGDAVHTGDPLLSMDDSEEHLAVVLDEAQLGAANAQLQLAQETLNITKQNYQLYKRIHDDRAVSQLELNEVQHKVNEAAFTMEHQKKQLEAAKAAFNISKNREAKTKLLSPKDAIVLQIGMHAGELAVPSYEQPVMLLGDLDKVYVRVAIDEREAWKFKKNAPALIKSLGDAHLTIPLTYLRTDHYVVNKTFSLSQFSTALDSQALEVVYYFKRSNYPLVVSGEQFDAYIG